MSQTLNRNIGNRRSRGRESRRVLRDRRILSFLLRMISKAEHFHALHAEPVEPLSVFYGKPEFLANPDIPPDSDLTPFPIAFQEHGLPMPQWEDLSQWMKVMMATMACHQWDLLTFNIHVHPELERKLVARQRVRSLLAERVRKHLERTVGPGREIFFVIESFSKHTLAPTFLHLHGAVAVYGGGEGKRIEAALARAAGHVRGASKQPRAVHSDWFTNLRAGYGNYLFKFAKRFDQRLDHKRLVMSHSMTRAARDLWIDITRPSFRTAQPAEPTPTV